MKPTKSRPHFIRCSNLNDVVMRTVSPESGQKFTYALYVPERRGVLLADDIREIVSEIAGGFGVDQTCDDQNARPETESETALRVRIEVMQICVDVHLVETMCTIPFSETKRMSEDEIMLALVCPTVSREEDLRSRGYWNERPWTAPFALPLVGWKLGAEEYWPRIPDHHGNGIYLIDASTDTAFMDGISKLGLMDFRTNAQTYVSPTRGTLSEQAAADSA